MSEGQEFPQVQSEEVVSLPSQMKDLQEFLSGKGIAEIETSHLFSSDPYSFLPGNSEPLVGQTNVIQSIFMEVDSLIEEELKEISRPQKRIALWEERIRKNNSLIEEHSKAIQQNLFDMACDLKSRDFWFSRASQVLSDQKQTEASGASSDWVWLIKKYGFKNEEGAVIESRDPRIVELSQKAADLLAAEYRNAGMRYEHMHKQKEFSNQLLVNDSEKLAGMNLQLQKYIANTYTSEVEPLQDGVLLFKELVIKLRVLECQEIPATYGDLRRWAEAFLDQFLRTNPLTPGRVITTFRRLTLIPLPAQNS